MTTPQHLAILAFDDEVQARKVHKLIKKGGDDSPLTEVIEIEDLVLIKRSRSGKVKIDSSADDDVQDGLGKKALIGMLVPGPVGVGVAINVLRGKRKAKKAGDVGVADDLLSVIGERVPNDGAALVVLTSVTPPRERLAEVARNVGASLDIDEIVTEEGGN